MIKTYSLNVNTILQNTLNSTTNSNSEKSGRTLPNVSYIVNSFKKQCFHLSDHFIPLQYFVQYFGLFLLQWQLHRLLGLCRHAVTLCIEWSLQSCQVWSHVMVKPLCIIIIWKEVKMCWFFFIESLEKNKM